MERCKRALTLFALLAVVATSLTFASTSEARAATLQSRFTAARHALHIAKVRLARAQAQLAAATAAQATATTPPTPAAAAAVPAAQPTASPAPTPTPTATPTPAPITAAQIAALQATVKHARTRVAAWQKVVLRLARQVRLQRLMALWERKGQWRPLIKVIAAKYHVSAVGLYRMMMLESGGRRFARGGGGMFLGLYQYYPGTWRAHWNPWRRASIFDGSAQISATAYAVRHGMARHMWPNTYPRAF